MRFRLALIALTLSTLACMEQIVTPTPTAPAATPTIPTPPAAATGTPSAVPTAEADTAVIQATVWVRLSDNSDSDRIGSLTTGDRVEIVECAGDWCKISEPISGYVWRGCTDNNPDNLLCEAKP